MKIRSGFISNSSSSSFILFKSYLTKEQIDHLKDYEHYALSDEYKKIVDNYEGDDKPQHERERLSELLNNDIPKDKKWKDYIEKQYEKSPDYSYEDYDYYPEGWGVEETFDIVDVSTVMNNFDMKFFCKMIGVDIDKCGLMIEDEHELTLGHNDAKTDLKNYVNDDNYWDHPGKYFYEGKYYKDSIYPIQKEMFDKKYISSVIQPGGKVRTIRDDSGKIIEESVDWS